MLSAAEQTMCNARPNVIDHARVKSLHYLGNYTRKLPVSITRMMENAYDWEHLPYVHASSFGSIHLIDSGKWGWRAKLCLPEASGGGEQIIDLLVDGEKNYWATTVFSGAGEGVEIHTQATALSDQQIKIDVRFYLPEDPGPEFSAAGLAYLQQQYATLYDEDLDLMTGRQSALDHVQQWRSGDTDPSEIAVGRLDTLDPLTTHIVETDKGRYCVRRWQDKWIAHSAVCPHLLGPLDDSAIDADGTVTCPWHGYRFDVTSGDNLGTGDNVGGKCRNLTILTAPVERDGVLYLNIGA